jgi:ribonucleoside-triphosphate reductase
MAANGLEELSKFTITSKYAKYLPEKKRRETWDEIVERSLNMHLKKFNYLPENDLNEIKWAFGLVKEKKVLPSSRGLQFAGIGVEKHNARLYNCCFLHIHSTRTIEKAFYLLLCGVGCGFGLGKRWVSKFPSVVKEKTKNITYRIEDSIEGWATSTKVLVDSFLEGNEYSAVKVHFDYSLIRPEGSPVSHGGVAPGPQGLIHAHLLIEKLLEELPSKELRTIDVYDILMHIAGAVLSGGIRRAACIALFDKEDNLMLNAKVGNWLQENKQRAMSNNTVLLKRDETTLEDFKYIIERTRQFGEPGFAFVDDLDAGLNPCAEAGFYPFYNGVASTQFCNLDTINGNKVKTREQFLEYTKAASIIGTLQAAYTDFKFLDKEDILMTEEEALLGVSILGQMSNPEILTDADILAEGSSLVVEINEIWAKKLGINPAARATVIKPDGNSSCVLESPFSGIHPAHSRKYFRRVQVNKNDKVYQHFKAANPHLCEESVYSATTADDVIAFPVRLDGGIIKDELNAIQHLDIIKKVNQSWIKGAEKHNKRPISHSVSCTVIVGEDEWDSVADYLFENKNNFTSISLLSKSGDKDYPQAPYEAIKTPDEYHWWNSLNQQTKNVDYTLLIEKEDYTKHSEEIACAGGACLI